MRPRLISIVLPVYNEGENIAECLRRLDRALKGVEHEILVCYDFEEDTTLPAIRAMSDLSPTVKLTRNTIGRGAPNAIRTGFRAAAGDVVVTTMADLSDPPEVIPQMAAAIRAGNAVVSGSRYMPGGSQSGGPLIKRTMSRVAGRLLHDLAGLGTRDATTNFRAYAAQFLSRIEIESKRGFEIALELTVKAQQLGLGVSEVPSSWTDRSAGQSNFKLWKWLPNYLHWFWVAMRQPLACMALALLLSTLGFVFASDPRQRSVVALLFLTALSMLLTARRLRGRNVWLDLLHPVSWLAPVLFSGPSLFLLLAAVPSGALLLATRARRQS
jgi:glycosyltransferase involved in cell wall biosynthesis